MRKHLSTFLILLFLQSSAYGAVLVAPSSTVPDATETVKGKVELATDAETVTGTDDTRATTPAGVTAKMSAPGAIGDTTPSTGAFTLLTGGVDNVIASVTDTLTVQQCRGTLITNYGQGAENTQTLPASEEGLNYLVLLVTTGNAFHLKAAPGDKIYLDGTALDDGDKITCATPVAMDMLSVLAIKTGAVEYNWLVRTVAGTWTDGGM